jgi:leader peptidase (prepilin peptidase)/N-methyltransferase
MTYTMFIAIGIEYNGFMNILVILPILTGLLAGFLVNYLADVLPNTRRFGQPVCLHCNTPLSIKDYITLSKCPSCRKNRHLRAWTVHILGLVFSLWIWFLPPRNFVDAISNPLLAYLTGLLLLIYFAIVFVIDIEHRLILHPVSIVGAFLGLGYGWLLNGLGPTLIGGVAGFGIMLIFYLFGTLFARVRARRMRAAGQETDDEEALGAGDVILAGVLGLVLGWPLIWFGLLVGILLGGLITIPMLVIMVIARRYKQDAWMVFIPYGPFFLISATLIVYLPDLLSTLVPK